MKDGDIINKGIISLKNIMNSIVPITRFNRGEANKIFDEVSENGIKVVLKNNIPTCVLINPEQYESMVEALEDYALYIEAEKRSKAAEIEGYISSDEVYNDLKISETDLEDIDVELD